MFRTTRIVPTTILTAAALALAAPAAQAMPTAQTHSGTSLGATRLADSARDFPTRGPVVSPGLSHGADKVTVARDFPLPNPVKTPATIGTGLIHSSTVQAQIGLGRSVSAPDTSSGFNWTAASIGAAMGGVLMLVLAAGAGIRRRGQLAT